MGSLHQQRLITAQDSATSEVQSRLRGQRPASRSRQFFKLLLASSLLLCRFHSGGLELPTRADQLLIETACIVLCNDVLLDVITTIQKRQAKRQLQIAE